MLGKTIRSSRKDYLLKVDVTTSTFKDHNSFDFESTTHDLKQVVSSYFKFSLAIKYIFIFRNEITFQTRFIEAETLLVNEWNKKDEDLIGAFQIRYIDKRIVLRFYEVQDLFLHQKYGVQNKSRVLNSSIHHIYLVVRSMKNESNESIGYKLQEGSLLKVGQKQYFVSSVYSLQEGGRQSIRDKLMLIDSIINGQSKTYIEKSQPLKGECKYCMTEQGPQEIQFLCSPCKCSGSCAMVHFTCLQKWNQSKVKKNQTEGLTYYNFDKFFCEVCKQEYPKFIQKRGKTYQLMPIEIPKADHLILEQIDIKSSSLICVEKVPEDGLRIGRGNECQIKIESPSISRNHAKIRKIEGDYYVFDNKSKFGTTVRDNKIYLQVSMSKKGIQIDRSVLMFQLAKNNLLA